jgi:hypothetical protein
MNNTQQQNDMTRRAFGFVAAFAVALFLSVFKGRPYSRAVLWIFFPFLLLIMLQKYVPQIADILSPGWTLERSATGMYYFAYGYCIAEWSIFSLYLFRLDALLSLSEYEPHLRDFADQQRPVFQLGISALAKVMLSHSPILGEI